MSEVERYYIGVYGGEAQARVCLAGLKGMIRDSEGKHFTLAEDFDRLTAEHDALRNEVAQVKGKYDRAVNKVDALQQRLTAADERADAGIAFVTRLIECAGSQPSIATGYLCDILAALKPAEGGGDDA